MKCYIILYDNFETLDALGPAEIFGKIPEEFELIFCSEKGGIIKSTQGVEVLTQPFPQQIGSDEIILIPGGAGAIELASDIAFIDELRRLSLNAKYVLCVCTGSALLAKTDLLNNKNATSNKRSFEWVVAQNENVNWIRAARWVVDDKYYTSSGVSAGMDMSFGFISDIIGEEKATAIAKRIEYIWNRDKNNDPFAN